ncbi:MAG: type III-A CRISPR-associated RAMP protein Csm5 [Candidatus Helarchaeota archaeon]
MSQDFEIAKNIKRYENISYKLDCTVISPVSILSGDNYDLLDYSVEKENDLYFIYLVDQTKFGEDLKKIDYSKIKRVLHSMGGSSKAKKSFQQLINELGLSNHQQYLKKKNGYKIPIKIPDQNILNDFKNRCYEIKQIIKTPSKDFNLPYIPGSSFKGSLRNFYDLGFYLNNNTFLDHLNSYFTKLTQDSQHTTSRPRYGHRSRSHRKTKRFKPKDAYKNFFQHKNNSNLQLRFKTNNNLWHFILVEDSLPIDIKHLFIDNFDTLKRNGTDGSVGISIYLECLNPQTKFSSYIHFIDFKYNVSNFPSIIPIDEFFNYIKMGVKHSVSYLINRFKNFDNRANYIPKNIKNNNWPNNTLYLPIGFGTGWIFKSLGSLFEDHSEFKAFLKHVWRTRLRSTSNYFPTSYKISKTFKLMPGWIEIKYSKQN